MKALHLSAALVGLLLLGPPLDVSADDEDRAAKMIDRWAERYAIHRPWVAADDLPADVVRRTRGALAHVVSRLKGGRGIGEDLRLLIYKDLGRLLALDASTEEGRRAFLESRAAHGDAYGKLFDTDVFALWKRLILGETAPDIPWGRSVRETYYSRADGTGQTFEARFPPRIEGRDLYPMIVVLKGGPRVGPSREHPFIQVKPSGRGVWGPRSLSGWDAMQVVEHMKRHFPVDPDRISLTGFSAGASAAMHLAGLHADEFAAVMPMVAFGTGVPLFNLKNLPVAIHHGSDDWTSAVCNVRAQVRRLNRLKVPVEYVEYPGVGHSVPGPHGPLVKWMLERKRNPCPSSAAVECASPDLGRVAWIRILEFEDPHRLARIEASLEEGGGNVKVDAGNVRRFSLDLPLIRRHRSQEPRIIKIGDQQFRITDAPRAQTVECTRTEGGWEVRTADPPTAKRPHPYRAGAAANLYQGDPLILVYGTGSPEARRRTLAHQLARKLSSTGGPHHAATRSRFPVAADTEVTPEQEAHCNLILIGTPEENRLIGRILPDLPISIRDGVLDVAGRPGLPLRNRVLSVLARNPNHPDRLVYLIAPFTDAAGLERFIRGAPQRALIGSDGFDRLSRADLVVQNLDGEIGRRMQFDKAWRWITPPGSDRPLPPRFRDRAEVARALTGVMARGSEADVGLWWGPADKGMWGYDFNFLTRYDPEFFTEADFRTRRDPIETMVGGVSGRDLKEIWSRWGENGELVFSPGFDAGTLEDEKRYRIRIPMDLYIKLGRRKKTLDAPAFGPPITAEAMRRALFP